MKLHLPKALLTAVLAVCVAPAVIAEDVITLNGSNGGADRDLTNIYGDNGTFVRAKSGTAVTDTIGTLTAASGKSKFVIAGEWNDANSRFESLTIDKFVVGDGTGTVKLQIGTEQGNNTSANKVVIKEFAGVINGLELANKSTLTIDKSASIAVGTELKLGEGTNLILNNAGTITMRSDGSASSAVKATGSGMLTIGDGTTVNFANTSQQQTSAIQGDIAVKGGGTLNLSGNAKSLLGWANSNQGKLLLEGSSADKMATVNITTSLNQHLSRTLEMKGNAQITGASAILETYSGSIVASGTNNKIASQIEVNRPFAVTVSGASDTLELSGRIYGNGNTFTKKGEGLLTVSGTNNYFNKVFTNEAGVTKFSGTTVFNEGISVAGGEVEFGSDIELKKAIALTNSGSLDLGTGTIITISDLSKFSYKDTFANRNANENGFAVLDKVYTIVSGATAANMSGSATIKLNANDVGQLLSSTGTYTVAETETTTTYVVNTGDVYTSSSAVAGATGFMVYSHAGQTAGNLVIDGDVGSLSAAQILTDTVGNGNITVASNITLSSGATSQATGKLTINDATLSMGVDKGDTFDLSSFTSVDLNNATIKYHGANTTLKNVTVGATGATLSFYDMKGDNPGECDVMTLSGTTTLKGQLTVESTQWKYKLNIASLTGSGNLSVASSEEQSAPAIVQVALDNYTGSINVTQNKGAATLNATSDDVVNLKGITLSGGATGWIKISNTTTSNESSLGAISLSGGSDLRIWNVDATGITNISSLTVSGSATLGTYRDGSSFQGTVNIASLSSQGESAELTLKNASQTDDATVINLNGGTFTGTIKLESDSHRGSGQDNRSRDLQVNLKNVNVAAGSIIAFQNPSTADGSTHDRSNFITLGVGVEGAKVAGLTGTTTNAATIKATEGTKSLEIITADGADYSTNAKVESSVNLVKSGAGKQTISGAVSTTGSVKVNAGELALTGTSTLSLNQLSLFDTTNATGGTLSVGSANGGTVSIVSAGDKVGSVVVGQGSILNGNLTLGAGTALILNGYGDNAATINGTLTLGSGMQVSGLEQLLNDLAAQEAGADGLKSLKLFNVTAVDFGTVEATLAMAADALVEEQPLIAGYDASKYFSTLSVGEYALVFQNSALYIQATAPIPEPTTATLSLLALTALAARRRRK